MEQHSADSSRAINVALNSCIQIMDPWSTMILPWRDCWALRSRWWPLTSLLATHQPVGQILQTCRALSLHPVLHWPTLPQLGNRYRRVLWGTVKKSISKCQRNLFPLHLSICWACDLILEEIGSVKQDFLFVNACWLCPMVMLSFKLLMAPSLYLSPP